MQVSVCLIYFLFFIEFKRNSSVFHWLIIYIYIYIIDHNRMLIVTIYNNCKHILNEVKSLFADRMRHSQMAWNSNWSTEVCCNVSYILNSFSTTTFQSLLTVLATLSSDFPNQNVVIYVSRCWIYITLNFIILLEVVQV